VAKGFTDDDDALLEELGVEVETKKETGRTAREERAVAGFEEIQRFVDQRGHAPQHGEDRDIFERLYAVRLDRLRELPDCRAVLEPLDRQGLLAGVAPAPVAAADDLDDDALLTELGVDTAVEAIAELKHVRSAADKRAAEEIASRTKCEDFDQFKPLFAEAQRDLDTGARTTRPFVRDAGFLKADITEGQFFILGGQIAYVAEVGETFKAPNGEYDARLRVIYSNGTQSNLLRRSLQRALYKDEAGRRITDPSAGPLFAGESEDGDLASGTIYVMRSKSDNPAVVANRGILHKIGVTGGKVETRIANAKLDPTFLMADVEIVATYALYNISRTKLENLIHHIFGSAQLNIEIKDRFGQPVIPREWFLVPLFVVDEAVDKIKNGTIADYIYDPHMARLRRADQTLAKSSTLNATATGQAC
jgi:Meiotically up-regulated gene 113